jgi:hypothetical protein
VRVLCVLRGIGLCGTKLIEVVVVQYVLADVSLSVVLEELERGDSFLPGGVNADLEKVL